MDDATLGISISSMIGVVALYLLNKFKPVGFSQFSKQLAQQSEKIDDQGKRLVGLEVKMEPFWHLIQTKLVDILHSEHPPRYFELVNKFKQGNLSIEEAIEFKKMIEESLPVYQNTDPTKFLVAILVVSKLEADQKSRMVQSG